MVGAAGIITGRLRGPGANKNAGGVAELAKQFFKTGVWRGALTRENPAGASVRYWIPPLLVLGTLFWFPIWIYLIGIAILAGSAKEITERQKLWLMVVLPTMHYAWGTGFWWGLFRGNKTT